MKTIIISVQRVSLTIAVLAILIIVFTTKNAQASTIESYTITAVETAVNTSVNAWDLQYSESGNSLKIYMTEKNGEKEYIVRGEFIEVSYVLNKNGFGARPVKGSKSQVPAQILNNVMNSEKLNQQRIISQEQIDNDAALNLIAGFLPDLLNENYKHLLK
jgi:hypothetical protein